MSEQDNSVNIENAGAKSAGSYHHGDLRAAVIAAGLKRLEEGDGAELGLRALARDVGVSATALYRHFPDKEALLDALADEGLRRLGALQAQAWLKAGGGRGGFLATGVAYVRFAHDEPAVFRLSFTRQMTERSKQNGDGGEVAYNLLRAGVEQTMAHLDDPEVAAMHAWSLVHGLAMLVLDRRIEWNEARIEQIVGMTFGGVD
jgi:AcrR family transcriptional regulator